jgi:hypothetical protein
MASTMPVTICTPRQKARMPPKVYQMFRFLGVGKVRMVSCISRGSGRRASSQRSKPELGL